MLGVDQSSVSETAINESKSGGFLDKVCDVCKGLGEIGKILLPFVRIFAPQALPLITAITAVCSVIGLLKPGEKLEDFGKAMEQTGLKKEDFESYKEYIEALRSEIQAGRVDLSSCGEVKDMAYALAAAALFTQCLDETLSIKGSPEFYLIMSEKFSDGKEFQGVLEGISEKGIDTADVCAYLNAESPTDATLGEVAEVLAQGIQNAHVGMSEDESYRELDKRL